MIDTKEINELLNSRDLSLELKFQNAVNIYQTKELDFDIKTPTSTQEITKRFRPLSMEEAEKKETKSAKLDEVLREQMIYSEPSEITEDN
jgi:ribosomal protein L11